jgi:hypothetical protein
MSSFSIEPADSGTIHLGYDPILDSYFLQVWRPDEVGNLQISRWLGSGGPGEDGLIRTPEVVLDRAAEHGRIPVGLLAVLQEDRSLRPQPLELGHVVYAGMPTQEVWRWRAGRDPHGGTKIIVKEHEIHSWERQAALAILSDALKSENRARKLATRFCMLQVKFRRRTWLLNEDDIRTGILSAEDIGNLRWLPTFNCYAGRGAVSDRTPEAQLRRAASVDKTVRDRTLEAMFA